MRGPCAHDACGATGGAVALIGASAIGHNDAQVRAPGREWDNEGVSAPNVTRPSATRPHVIAVVGPTATGKSDLALDLAERLDGEIVNSDASQFYRGMDIGTAKVPVAERRGIPHHQIDTLDILEEATIARFQTEARRDIDDVLARGKTPIVVGGSGLYVRAALDVLNIPPTDPQVRAHFERRLEKEGSGALYRELEQKDPKAAAGILPSNGRRVVRALEVIELTGDTFSSTAPTKTFLKPTILLGLHADPDVLVHRIERRVELMWEQGLLDEVRQLDAQGLRRGRTASRAIGYSQALDQLDGRLTQEQAQESTAIATRQFARRQRAWFRPDPRPVWLEYDAPNLLDAALAEVDAYDPARHGEVAVDA